MNFESIADKYPSERLTVERLGELLSGQNEDAEYTLNRLADLVHPRSKEGLALVLGEMVRQGALKQIFRVISPQTQGGIAKYESIDEVPDVVHDWRTDTDVQVDTDNLRVVYAGRGR